ncbi:hypothetical protein MaudCBS49596_003613 [Microsporum audouinii]
MAGWTRESLLSHLSYGHLVEQEAVVPSLLPRRLDIKHRAASASTLESLPLEILHLICEKADLLSLLRLSRTSIRAREAITSFPAFAFLLAHASSTLKALSQTNLLPYHACIDIYAALRSRTCASCHAAPGIYFFLLDCQRVCFSCLRINPALWIIPLPFARRCFKLDLDYSTPSASLLQIPILQVRGKEACTSVQSARWLATSIHGSMEEVYRLQAEGGMHASSLMEGYLMQFLRDAPLQPFTPFMLSSTGWWEELSDFYSTMLDELCITSRGCVASSLSLSVSDGTATTASVESDGLWCRGCSRMVSWYRQGRLGSEAASIIMPGVPQGFEMVEALYRRASCVWSRDRFWEHVASCYAVAEEMPEISRVMADLHLI